MRLSNLSSSEDLKNKHVTGGQDNGLSLEVFCAASIITLTQRQCDLCIDANYGINDLNVISN